MIFLKSPGALTRQKLIGPSGDYPSCTTQIRGTRRQCPRVRKPRLSVKPVKNETMTVMRRSPTPVTPLSSTSGGETMMKEGAPVIPRTPKSQARDEVDIDPRMVGIHILVSTVHIDPRIIGIRVSIIPINPRVTAAHIMIIRNTVESRVSVRKPAAHMIIRHTAESRVSVRKAAALLKILPTCPFTSGGSMSSWRVRM